MAATGCGIGHGAGDGRGSACSTIDCYRMEYRGAWDHGAQGRVRELRPRQRLTHLARGAHSAMASGCTTTRAVAHTCPADNELHKRLLPHTTRAHFLPMARERALTTGRLLSARRASRRIRHALHPLDIDLIPAPCAHSGREAPSDRQAPAFRAGPACRFCRPCPRCRAFPSCP